MLECARNHQVATVCLIGSFPPTAGGQGLVNESFKRLTEEAGATVRIIDLSPRSGPATLRRRLSRIPKVLIGIPKLSALLVRRRADSVYIGVAGGYAQLYDIVFTSLTRLSRARIFLHHDSYAYLERRRLMTAALVRVAGPSAIHIVQCEDMKGRLTELYGRTLQVVAVANATNIEPPTNKPRVRTKLKTIGFMSHLSRSKGVLEFIDVAERVCRARPDMRALLAGRIEEPSLAPVMKERLLGASWIEYIGPVEGDTKSRFYSNIDAFVFPTRHAHESDPRIVNEAQAHGVAILTRGRGCIPSVVIGGGAVIRDGDDFVGEAERLLLEWYQDPAKFSSISSGALANAARLQAEHGPRLRALIKELVSNPRPDATPPFSIAPPRDDGSRGDESSE